jgi:hypothetical protein
MIRTNGRRLLTSALLLSCSSHANETSSPPDAGMDGPVYVLPPVRDASLPADSANVLDRVKTHCGTVTGAIQGELLCDHLFPDLNWDHQGSYTGISLGPMLAPGAVGADAEVAGAYLEGFVFMIDTPDPSAPLTETCSTLPPNARIEGGYDDWGVICSATSNSVPGSSFTLTITAVGTLTSDSLGADPLDASADGFDWDAEKGEVLSNSFHGSFKAHLVSMSGSNAPIDLDMSF